METDDVMIRLCSNQDLANFKLKPDDRCGLFAHMLPALSVKSDQITPTKP